MGLGSAIGWFWNPITVQTEGERGRFLPVLDVKKAGQGGSFLREARLFAESKSGFGA